MATGDGFGIEPGSGLDLTTLDARYVKIEDLPAGSKPVPGISGTYNSGSTYPYRVPKYEWYDAGGSGGNVRLPLVSGCTVGDAVGVCNAGSGTVTVVTTDAATINGSASFPMPTQWEQYIFFYTGSEWRVKG